MDYVVIERIPEAPRVPLPPRKHKPQDSLAINVPDVALIFEGGGMRCSYTAGVVSMLVEQGLNFPKVYGVSAGASNSVNYLSHDVERARASFVDLVKDPRFGGWGSFIRGTGYFNAPYLYEELVESLAGSDDPMAFDAATFLRNPADIHIEAFDWDTGESVVWTKEDMDDWRSICRYVRASSTMPIFMEPTTINGHTYMDGGMGDSWGILLHAAQADGFKRFFVVRSQERSYRKKPFDRATERLFRLAFHKHPLVAERSIERWHHYNDLLDEIDELAAAGQAYVFAPETMNLSNKEAHLSKLQEAYDRGYAQAYRELDSLRQWLWGS